MILYFEDNLHMLGDFFEIIVRATMGNQKLRVNCFHISNKNNYKRRHQHKDEYRVFLSESNIYACHQ